jgi:hypothetical protein
VIRSRARYLLAYVNAKPQYNFSFNPEVSFQVLDHRATPGRREIGTLSSQDFSQSSREPIAHLADNLLLEIATAAQTSPRRYDANAVYLLTCCAYWSHVSSFELVSRHHGVPRGRRHMLQLSPRCRGPPSSIENQPSTTQPWVK